MKNWTDESDLIYVGASKAWLHLQFFFLLFLVVKILLLLASSLRLSVDKFFMCNFCFILLPISSCMFVSANPIFLNRFWCLTVIKSHIIWAEMFLIWDIRKLLCGAWSVSVVVWAARWLCLLKGFSAGQIAYCVGKKVARNMFFWPPDFISWLDEPYPETLKATGSIFLFRVALYEVDVQLFV